MCARVKTVHAGDDYTRTALAIHMYSAALDQLTKIYEKQ